MVTPLFSQIVAMGFRPPLDIDLDPIEKRSLLVHKKEEMRSHLLPDIASSSIGVITHLPVEDLGPWVCRNRSCYIGTVSCSPDVFSRIVDINLDLV